MRYLNPASHHRARITKTHKNLTKKHDFKDITFLVKPKITEIHKIEKKKKKRIPSVLAFLAMEIKKTSNLCIKKML